MKCERMPLELVFMMEKRGETALVPKPNEAESIEILDRGTQLGA
jgi:hypothetical protein